MNINLFYYYVICLSSGAVGAWIIQTYGHKIGIVDVPNARSSHSKILPKGGGIGILFAFIVSPFFLNISKTFWIPAVILSLISFLGDRYEIHPKIRLIIQFLCSMFFLVGLFALKQLEFPFYLCILPCSIFIMGTLNFFNFMDGINGISGISGMVGFFLLWLYGYFSGVDSSYMTLCMGITLACAGFIPFNFPGAKVFMGDIGSILLGFVFACIVILLSNSLVDFFCMAGFLFLFYADELSTMTIRIKDKEPLTRPHRKHLYQLLANECNISHWKISLAYGIVQLLIGLSLLVLRTFSAEALVSALIAYLVCFIAVTVRVRVKLKCL